MEGPFVLPRRGLVRDAADRWFRARGMVPEVVAEPEGHEALLTLAALGFGTGIVPRLVLDHSAVRDRLTILPADPPPTAAHDRPVRPARRPVPSSGRRVVVIGSRRR